MKRTILFTAGMSAFLVAICLFAGSYEPGDQQYVLHLEDDGYRYEMTDEDWAWQKSLIERKSLIQKHLKDKGTVRTYVLTKKKCGTLPVYVDLEDENRLLVYVDEFNEFAIDLKKKRITTNIDTYRGPKGNFFTVLASRKGAICGMGVRGKGFSVFTKESVSWY